MDLPIVLSHKTAWLYHNVARPSEPLSRASSLYDEDSLASEAEPTASLPKLGLDAKGLRASMAVANTSKSALRPLAPNSSMPDCMTSSLRPVSPGLLQ